MATSPYLAKKIAELTLEKKKYFAKVLKKGAQWDAFTRLLDLEDYFSEWAWFEALFFNWLNVSSIFIWGLEPYEMYPLIMDFDIELPSVEEWLQGIELRFDFFDLSSIFEELLSFQNFIEGIVLPEFQPYFQINKLIIGKTKYGEGYVDPPVVREFLRATFYELLKRRVDLSRLYDVYKTIVEKLDVAESVAESTYNRIALHLAPLFENFILDYNVLNYSKLCKRGSEKSTFPIVTWRGEEYDVNYSKHAELNCGFILNVTPLNLGYLMPRGQFYKQRRIELPEKRYVEKPGKGTTIVSWMIDYKVRKMLSRFRATLIGFANYQKVDEIEDYTKSERADQYGQLRAIFYHIDALVDSMLEGEGVDSFRRNMYRQAVKQLIGHRKKRHRWGYEAFKTMSEEEFKEWWLEYWSKQGLNRGLLEVIYDRVSKWLPHLRSEVESLGKRLRERRYRLAQSLA